MPEVKCRCGAEAIRIVTSLDNNSAYGVCINDLIAEAVGYLLSRIAKMPSDAIRDACKLLDQAIKDAPDATLETVLALMREEGIIITEGMVERIKVDDSTERIKTDEDNDGGDRRVGDDYVHTDSDIDTSDDDNDADDDEEFDISDQIPEVGGRARGIETDDQFASRIDKLSREGTERE